MNTEIQKFIIGAIGGAFDATISTFPGIATVWGAIKGGVSNIKEKRAEEFIILIQNNANILNFNDEKFVDGLALSFESFLRQRIELKRQIIKKIFLGFAINNDKDNFDLERFYDVLNRVTIKQINIFTSLKKSRNVSIMTKSFREIPKHHIDYSEYKYLEYLGLVGISYNIEIKTGYDESMLEEEETAFITDFGQEFIEYIC